LKSELISILIKQKKYQNEGPKMYPTFLLQLRYFTVNFSDLMSFFHFYKCQIATLNIL